MVTTRVLKVLNSKDLPDEKSRNKSYLYFCYDKMELYLFQSKYSDPFSIVEKLPDKSMMVENMLYITLDGYLYTYYNYNVISLGAVERNSSGVIDPNQLSLLKNVGSIYFMNAEERYLDPQTRTIQLPFQNGNYELNLSLGSELMIDKDTIIRFDPKTNQFYIAGKDYQPDDRLNNIGRYVGNNTKSVNTSIDGFGVESNLIIDPAEENGVKIAIDGIMVDVSDFASKERFENIINAYAQYRYIVDSYIKELSSAVQKVVGSVSQATINEQILKALENYKKTISEMFEKYDAIAKEMQNVENITGKELDDRIDEMKQDFIDYVNKTNTGAWTYFNEDLYGEQLTENELDIQTRLIEEYRNQVKLARKNTTADENTTYNLYGLTPSEQTIQDKLLMEFNRLVAENKTHIYYSSKNDLPEIGESEYKYYVINITDTNKLFRIYTWNFDNKAYNCIYDLDPKATDTATTTN